MNTNWMLLSSVVSSNVKLKAIQDKQVMVMLMIMPMPSPSVFLATKEESS